MAKQVIDLGSVIANGADGDTAREAFTKVNANFTEVYDSLQNQSGNLDAKVDKVVGKSLVDDAEIAKLATVQANATQNNTDAYLLARVNHTGTQAISTVDGLQTAINSKANTADLGTAAYTDSTTYATALQGSKADTAAQLADLGTAAFTPSSDYATAAQGSKADTAAQVSDLGTAAYADALAFEKLLSAGSGIMIDRTNPSAPVISAGGAGAGDVTGPNSSITNEVVLFDGVSGKNLKGGGVLGTSAFTDTIDTIGQPEAEAGTSTERRVWTAERVRQAVTSWWLSTSSPFARTLVEAADSQEARSVLGIVESPGRNKIINGKMEIAQRGTSVSPLGVGNAYTLDRWSWTSAGIAAFVTASQQSDVPSDNEFSNSLRLTVTTADTAIAAGDLASIEQRIEGYNIRDMVGKTFTLSFRVRSSKTGKHCVFLSNSGGDRSYVAEYTVDVANTWEKKTVVVSGGLITAGTWNWSNGTGLQVGWVLAAGSTFHNTANTWHTGSFKATSNQVNCLDTIGNIFAITGVQLEVGSTATAFEHRLHGQEITLCQRYYQTVFGGYSGSAVNAANNTGIIEYMVTPRASPTVTWSLILFGNAFPTTAPTIGTVSINGFRATRTANATLQDGSFIDLYNVSAEL